MSLRILVTGSRTWTDREAVHHSLTTAVRELTFDGEIIVVHGGARGADTFAAEWASARLEARAERHDADWQLWGKRAGMKRNSEMVALGADLCLAFIRDNSPGASHCAELARKAGIPTITVRPNAEPAPAGSGAPEEGDHG